MIVEAHYKWNGDLSNYKRENSFIPIDPGNTDFQEIQKLISEGNCTVLEPLVGSVYRSYDKHGLFSGYRTRFGFVPDDNKNPLLKLIKKQILDGSCTVIDPKMQPALEMRPNLSKLIFPVILDAPWPFIQDKFHSEFCYSSNQKSTKYAYQFTIRNLPEKTSYIYQSLLEDYQIDKPDLIPGPKLQFGLIEIEVPISRLRKLFFEQKNNGTESMNSMISDMLDQHYLETQRKKSEGPDISWLISNAHNYTKHFVVEFSNQVIEAFRTEFGKSAIQYLPEIRLNQDMLVMGCNESGVLSLQSHTSCRSHSFDLNGEWHPSSLIRYEERNQSATYYQETALQRVSEMIQFGFHVEALGPLNAFLEVIFHWALLSSIHDNQIYSEWLKKIGHRVRLEILELIANSNLNAYIFNTKFKENILNAKQIYKHRNDYIHTLNLPEITGRLTLIDRRKLELLFNSFLDHHERNQFFIRISAIAENQYSTKEIIVNEIQRRLEATQKNLL
jgi:hypothetical protein